MHFLNCGIRGTLDYGVPGLHLGYMHFLIK